ncbi:MAG: twin-arginine translocation signal domain-containing protein, partial [Pirellulales bacterium]
MTNTPTGMSRRHFMSHMAGASAMAAPALMMGQSIKANAAEL